MIWAAAQKRTGSSIAYYHEQITWHNQDRGIEIMALRWFAVPRVGAGLSTEAYQPKYSDQVDAWAGQDITWNGENWYIARFTADTTTLDNIQAESDAYTLEETGLSKQDIVDWLNEKTGHSYSFEEWQQRFIAGEV